MRNRFFEELLTRTDTSKIVVIAIDQPTGFDSELKEALGERFIMDAIAEQAVVGLVSGLSYQGFIPVLYNFAAFSLRRSYEQLYLDICLPKRKLVILGQGAGYAMSHLGNSHTINEDLTIARSLPNMESLSPCDDNEVATLMEYMFSSDRPQYLRLSRTGRPLLDDSYTQEELGVQSRLYGLTPDAARDRYILLSTGALSVQASLALQKLEGRLAAHDASCHHVHLAKLESGTLHRAVLSQHHLSTCLILQEHTHLGGLPTLIMEADLRAGRHHFSQMHMLVHIPTTLEKFGSQEQVWEYLGCNAYGIERKLEHLIFN